ncbi:MAG: hypothetical protein ACRYGI_19885 [Janthinobacterium lividum]
MSGSPSLLDQAAGILGPAALDQLSPETIRLQAEGLEKGQADKEAIGFAARNLDEEARSKEHDQTQSFRLNIHRATILGIWCAFVLVFIGMVSFVWNELAPVYWQWMSPEQTTTLKTFLFSTAVSGMIGKYVSPRLK